MTGSGGERNMSHTDGKDVGSFLGPPSITPQGLILSLVLVIQLPQLYGCLRQDYLFSPAGPGQSCGPVRVSAQAEGEGAQTFG